MSEKHLGQGSIMPPKTGDKWRLYSMLYCPYAQRSRIILELKGIPYETVNINLKDKPDWYLKIHPEGKVPLLDTGSQLIPESIDICEYINNKYPDPPLFDRDEHSIAKDKEILKNFDSLTTLFVKAVFKRSEGATLEHYLQEMKPHLQELEQELQRRGKFFGGSVPKFVDYMIWPWAERAPLVDIAHGQEVDYEKLGIPSLAAWYKEMKEQKGVKETVIDLDHHYKLIQAYASGKPVDYDNLEAFISRSKL